MNTGFPIDKNYEGPERRQSNRIPFSFPVRYVLCGYNKEKLKEEGHTEYTYSNNIGAGGIQMKMQKKPNLGKHIKMKLTLPMYQDNLIIQTVGQIIWTRLDEKENIYNVGVQFLDLDGIDLIKLEEFIQEALNDSK